MDGGRFDRLTRAWSLRIGRRSALRGLAATVAVGGLAAGEGAAAISPVPHCRPSGHTCRRDEQCCSGSCPVGRTVPIHERNRCACAEGLVRVNGRCVDLATDERHCGEVGNRCGAGNTC